MYFSSDQISETQTGPSYISATECGLTTPTNLADIGYPNMHVVMNINGACFGTGGSGPTMTSSCGNECDDYRGHA